MILSTATDINAIIGAICAIITTILIPVIAYFLKQRRKATKRNEIIDSVPEALKDIQTGIYEGEHVLYMTYVFMLEPIK